MVTPRYAAKRARCHAVNSLMHGRTASPAVSMPKYTSTPVVTRPIGRPTTRCVVASQVRVDQGARRMAAAALPRHRRTGSPAAIVTPTTVENEPGGGHGSPASQLDESHDDGAHRERGGHRVQGPYARPRTKQRSGGEPHGPPGQHA